MLHSSATAHRPSHHHPPSAHTHRARSSSDPFSDPVYSVHYSRSGAPPPPPKYSYDTAQQQQQYKKPARQHPDIRDPRMLESAVRDTVTVRQTDSAARARIGRSQTGGVQTTASGSRHAPPALGRRSYSQDSASQPTSSTDKNRKTGTKAKKSSTHADIIDKLDYTSGGAMFHHDGPFDACAPSRNRHKSKAPMMAWRSREDDPLMSAAHLRAERNRDFADVPGAEGFKYSPYPDLDLGDDYIEDKNPKQVDRIAEAWGVHEPEPYEEFFGGGGGNATGDDSTASSAYGGYEGNQKQNGRIRYQGRELRETYADSTPAKRPSGRLPPPQPIVLPGASRSSSLDGFPSPPSSGSPGAPKRSKSLMQKIRKMRDQPNVPVDAVQNDDSPSPPSSGENYAPGGYSDGGRASRPTHRQQNSFFGRIGRGASAHDGARSPKSDMSDSYVYIEKSTNKALPARPAETPATPYNGNEKDGYFDRPYSPGGGLGRKTSIVKKLKGAVRGSNK